ncbi:hypothetical protein [Gemmatimonas sp.]|uniref:hypothetical protein n=1 Tax=Gemmatimonas sp. TaxID=1962908 RepID=UPI0025BED9A6|nr:hypothetical protein [Gemmatimonas sp.]MCA2991177.1 hypothetical protein [Gemmatimonas sp.]
MIRFILRNQQRDEMEMMADDAVSEREQFASMLHDCENERDGWKHRAERAERYERLWNRHAKVIHEPAKEDVIGPIHGDRTVVVLPFGYLVQGHAEGFVGMDEVVRALDTTPTTETP